MHHLIRKYNVAGPRYTSYPTVPHWSDNMDSSDWAGAVKTTFDTSANKQGISIYIHLPFCESMCTFCGCHKRITKRHSVEQPYIDTLLAEWQLYLNVLKGKPILSELHLGGGTPTFFSPVNLERLLNGIFKTITLHENANLGFEGHPNNTTEAHLQTFYNFGFRRVSFGVQDYDPIVQKAINRIQSFEAVQSITRSARDLGYNSISHDLIFGLPHQSLAGISATIKRTVRLKPDRISFYSYAHVPWIKGLGQRGFSDNDIPDNEEKRALYELGEKLLSASGYSEIGIDHFALTSDELYKAKANKSLHRNFMGYTTSKTELMIGLGMSAISDAYTGFAQNHKDLPAYTASVHKGEFPVFRGFKLSKRDFKMRKIILDLMCNFKTIIADDLFSKEEFNQLNKRLWPFIQDELLTFEHGVIQVTKLGEMFVRNICMCFDDYLQSENTVQPRYSKTI